MKDNELKRKLRDSLQAMQGDDVPGFDAVWAYAERRYRATRTRYRNIAGFSAAAAIAATAFMLWPMNGDDVTGRYLTEQELMSSTQWLAPSDALLPEYRIDIYGELPVLMELNDLDEGLKL